MRPLRILHLEDNCIDAELVERELRQAGIEFQARRVEMESSFLKGLREFKPELILADYSLPSYDGLSALQAVKEVCPAVPFILVTGSLGEEKAVDALKAGATDYVLKQRLSRLGHAVRRAMRDVDERSRVEETEQKLRETEESFRDLFESAQDVILITDPDGNILRINRQGQLLTALTHEELIRRNLFRDMVVAEDLERFREVMRRVSAGEAPVCEIRLQVQDGRAVPFEGSFSGRLSAAGEFISMRCILRDITDKKRASEQLLRNQRIENIGTLAGGIAHDLNNVLGPIIMAVEMMRLKFTDKESQRLLSTLESSARRGADMVKQVLAFARGTKGGERIDVNLKYTLKELKSILQQIFSKSIRLDFAMANDLWTLECDPTQLHQVLMNLCVNARDAMPRGGNLGLTAENFTIDESFARMNPEAHAGAYVLLKVSDTGTGMAREILDRIFEPFFTTKGQGNGTGLGLATSLGIVKSSGGFIQVDSEAGKGTEFKLYFPACHAEKTTLGTAKDDALSLGNQELILVVDDEQSIVEIASQTLQMCGYRVLTARNGAVAVAVFAQHAGEIKLVLTDMMMPVMDGPAAIVALRDLDPQIKIIVNSGLGSGIIDANPYELGADAFLQKPYTAQTLARVVNEVLMKPSVTCDTPSI